MPFSFNPRAHAGRDRSGSAVHAGSGRFNPRAHAGRDDFIGGSRNAFNVSIHAPTRGATIDVGGVLSGAGVSIHAPTRGATAI